MKRLVFSRLPLALALACAAYVGLPHSTAVGAERAEVLAAVHSITSDEAKGFIDTLADDSFEGREAGSRGGRAAGNLLMKEFERHGLTPAGDGKTYFQLFHGHSRNILGLLEGSDPELKHEVVLIGAHYDHVGYGRVTNSFGPFGYVHNGADDNASGVAGLLEIAAAMQQLPTAPRRSVLFVFWDAEEQGLLGSQHWLAHSTLAGSRVVAAINMDMIGRLRGSRLEVYGTRTSTHLRRIVSQANRETGLALDFNWKMKADSDHWSFYTRSIPILMFHTGLHENYHRPSDDTHTINNEGVASVARVAFLTVLGLANRSAAPQFREAARREHAGVQAQLEQPVAPQGPRFGMPLTVEGNPPRFILQGVNPGSPAETAGLRAGDQLLALNGAAIENEARLRLDLLAAAGEVVFTIQRADTDLPLVVKVTPAGTPIRIGITWRADDAEPDTVLLTQVVYGSPAHVAGLAVRDRIYAVGGQRFAGSEGFSRLIATAPGEVEFEVETSGRLRTIALELAEAAAPAN
ncbi:MAG: M20/M25/M40 family metallo-hydrolase [Pirellulaceae bacterium]